MKSFVSLLLLTAVVACAYANPIAPEEDVAIDKRSIFGHHHGGFLGGLIHKAKDAVKKVGNGLKDVGKDIAKTGKKVVDKVGDTAKKIGKDIGKTAEHVVKDIVKKFKVEGKFIAHFVDKTGNDIGHFFRKEGKQVGHTLVVAGKKIEHIGRDVYDEVKEQVEKEIKNIDFDALLLRLVNLIDSPLTELGCAELSKKAAIAVAGPEAAPAVEAAGPVVKLACKVALHLLEMAAKAGVQHVHLNKKLH